MRKFDDEFELKYLRPGVKIDSKYVHIDPLFLFTRLSAIRQGETDSVKNLITNSRRNQCLSSKRVSCKSLKRPCYEMYC